MEISEKRRAQLAKAAAKWRTKNRGFSTDYARRTGYKSQKQWAKRNPEKMRKYARKFYWKDPEKSRAIRRESERKRRLENPVVVRETKRHYYRSMMERKVGRPRPNFCELCNVKFKKQPHADHDHKSGIYRGWICNRCNMTLGLVGDSPELLRALALWVEKFRENN